MTIEEMKEKLLAKEVTLRKLSRITGIDRENIKEKILAICSEKEKTKLLEVLEENRASSKMKLDDNLKEILIKILKGEISAREASILYGIDRETLRRKAEELANFSPQYVKYYIQYMGKRGDYSGINFRRLFVELIENNRTQAEIAEKYELPVRTISRELDKLGKSEEELDKKLYNIAKIFAEKHMKHEEISIHERKRYSIVLEEIKKKNNLISIKDEDSEEKSLRELKKFKELVERLRKKGLTEEKIAKKLEIGVSTIRRRLLKLEELAGIREKRNSLQELDEKE